MRFFSLIFFSACGWLYGQSTYLTLAYSPTYTYQSGSFDKLVGSGFRGAFHYQNYKGRFGGGLESSIRSIPYMQRVRYPYHWEEELQTGVIYSAGAFLSFTIIDRGDSHNLFVSLGRGLRFSEVYYQGSGGFLLSTPESTQYEADNYLEASLAYSLAVKPGLRFLVKPNFQFVGNFELDDRSSIARKFFLFSSLDVGLMITS